MQQTAQCKEICALDRRTRNTCLFRTCYRYVRNNVSRRVQETVALLTPQFSSTPDAAGGMVAGGTRSERPSGRKVEC